MSTSAAGEDLLPKWFVTRENGDMVPLIAFDELPSNIEIRGLNRTLAPQDLSGMTGLGVHASRHRQHHVTMKDTGLSRGIGIALAEARAASPEAIDCSESNPSVNANDTTDDFPHRTPKACDVEEKPTTDLIGPQGSLPWRAGAPALATRNRGSKEYCSYWIRKGECDYAQQGCIYKHEMPLDLLTLNQVGLQDIPLWYRELHGIPSYHSKNPKDIAYLRELCHLPASDRPFRRNWRSDGSAHKTRETHLARLPYEKGGQMFSSSAIEAARTSSNPAARITYRPATDRTTPGGRRVAATKRVPDYESDSEQYNAQAKQVAKCAAAITQQEDSKANSDILALKYPTLTPSPPTAPATTSSDDQRTSSPSDSGVYVDGSRLDTSNCHPNNDIDPLLRCDFDNEADDFVVRRRQPTGQATGSSSGTKNVKSVKPAARNPRAEPTRVRSRREATPRGGQRGDAGRLR